MPETKPVGWAVPTTMVGTAHPTSLRDPEADRRSDQRHSWLIALAVGGLTLAVACATYWRLYSSFAPYDDEGYILLSLRMFQSGHVLYDETSTQYGPAYFLLQDGLHHVLRLPMTHDVSRAKTLLVWLATAVLSGVLVWRLTGRILLAVIAGLGTVWHLDRLGLEPGHPQDVALVAILALLWLTVGMSRQHGSRLWCAALMGLAVGVLAMTKLNLGVLCGLAAAVTLLGSVTGRAARWAWTAVAVVGMALPWGLAGVHALSLSGVPLPAAVSVGWIGVWLWGRIRPDQIEQSRVPDSGWVAMGVLIVASLVTAAGFAFGAIAHGTTWTGLWHGLVGQHRGFLDLFYHHPPLPEWGVIWACAGVGLAMWSRFNPRVTAAVQWLAPGLLLCAGLHVFCESFRPFAHGLDDRAAAGLLAACVTPLAWLVLCGPSSGANSDLTRRLLAILAVTLPLSAYPTPGTQLAIGTWPALLIVAVVTGDWLTRLETDAPLAMPAVGTYLRGMAAVAVLTLLCRDVAAWRQWSAAEPLGLPGAEYLRLPPEEAESRRKVVQYLQDHADVFVASPTGCCSLYLWSGLAPPTTRNVTFWEVLLSERDQQSVIDALERAKHPLLVVDHRQAPVIHRNAPLFRYIERRFTTPEVTGPMEVWSPGAELAHSR
jgi:hypothetical protein